MFCPKLKLKNSANGGSVLVYFGNENSDCLPIPTHILCGEYKEPQKLTATEPDKKGQCSLTGESCFYSCWKDLRK